MPWWTICPLDVYKRQPYVTVVGGMNMDIGGWPSEELVAQDSNPGRVRMSPGGVGRNIAHNMSLMGLDVRLLTAFGDDVYAQKLAAVCGELGIDISQSPVIPGGHTSTYLFINDQQGDMQLAVSDMDIYPVSYTHLDVYKRQEERTSRIKEFDL